VIVNADGTFAFEENPGNFASQLEGPLHEDLQGVWNRWLMAKYPTRQSLEQAMGDLPESQDSGQGSVPLQNVYGGERAAIQFNVFFAEVEQKFFDRVKLFLREEIQCNAL
jgi:hypothetical protein